MFSIETRCQNILWNIIEDNSLTENNDATIASVKYFSRFDDLARCAELPGYKSLQDVADGMANKADKFTDGAHERLKSRKNIRDDDERAAMYALGAYRIYTTSECVKNLNFTNKLYYYTMYKGERTLAALGLANLFWRARHAPAWVRNTKQWLKRDKSKHLKTNS